MASLKMLATVCASRSVVHLKSSTAMSSCALSRPLFSYSIAHCTSSGIIPSASNVGFLVNAGDASTLVLLNCVLKRFVMRALTLALMHITRPASSRVVSFIGDFLDICEQRGTFLRLTPACVISLRLLLRAFRRIACMLILYGRFSSPRLVTFEVL